MFLLRQIRLPDALSIRDARIALLHGFRVACTPVIQFNDLSLYDILIDMGKGLFTEGEGQNDI